MSSREKDPLGGERSESFPHEGGEPIRYDITKKRERTCSVIFPFLSFLLSFFWVFLCVCLLVSHGVVRAVDDFFSLNHRKHHSAIVLGRNPVIPSFLQ